MIERVRGDYFMKERSGLDKPCLRKRIRKQSAALAWSDNLSCFKSLRSWSNDYEHSLAARGQGRGIQSKHKDT